MEEEILKYSFGAMVLLVAVLSGCYCVWLIYDLDEEAEYAGGKRRRKKKKR